MASTLDDVEVGVKGDGDAGVGEEFLGVLGMLACHEEYCGVGVAGLVASRKVVPPLAGAGVRLDPAVYRVLVRQAPAERHWQGDSLLAVDRAIR
jgi:hypothetical protein